jgi:hypothetical protein
VELSGLSTAVSNVSTARVQFGVSASALDKALAATTQEPSALIESRSVSEPPGLTFSPSGLSPGRSNRFVADL